MPSVLCREIKQTFVVTVTSFTSNRFQQFTPRIGKSGKSPEYVFLSGMNLTQVSEAEICWCPVTDLRDGHLSFPR